MHVVVIVERVIEVKIGETAMEKLRLALDLEKEAIERYNRGVELTRSKGDNGTRELLADILVSAEDHIDWLETQQETIRQIGADLYLSQHLHD